MSVYRLKSDRKNYMAFILDDGELLELMPDFNIFGLGKPMTWKWRAPHGNFIKSDNKTSVRPDISTWGRVNLVFSEEVKNKIENELLSCGELRLVEVDEKPFWLFNPTYVCDDSYIDMEKSVFEYFEGEIDRVAKLVLNEKIKQLNKYIFTTEIDEGVRLLVSEEFKKLIEDLGLKGLLFIDE